MTKGSPPLAAVTTFSKLCKNADKSII